MPYVTNETDDSGAPVRQLRGDRGTTKRLLSPDVGCERLVWQVNVLHPGGDPGPYHYHSAADNIYHVLSGTAAIVVEGTTYTAAAGDVMFIPAGERHNVANVGEDDLRLIECKIPADSDFIEAALPE